MNQLTKDEKAYETGQKDAADGHCVMISYNDWKEFGFEGSHEAYKKGFQDYQYCLDKEKENG